MWTSPLELKCLLMWLLFGFIKGNKPEKCPPPPSTRFADVTVKAYAPETKLYYVCDSGYDRRSGKSLRIQCKSDQQGAYWVYNKIECIEKKILLSMAPTTELHSTQKPESETQSPAAQKQEDISEFDQKDEKILLSTPPMMELEFTQKPEIKTMSPAPQKQENLSEFAPKGFCGPPKTFPHASLSMDRSYYVGQVLHFKCQSGYDKRFPTSGNSTCTKVNGMIIWTPFDMRCTSDSNESGSTSPSCFSSVTLSVTAICFVLLVIPAVFV